MRSRRGTAGLGSWPVTEGSDDDCKHEPGRGDEVDGQGTPCYLAFECGPVEAAGRLRSGPPDSGPDARRVLRYPGEVGEGQGDARCCPPGEDQAGGGDLERTGPRDEKGLHRDLADPPERCLRG